MFFLYSFIGCLRDRYGHIGWATYYGSKFHGKKTASGQQYDMSKLTAAHRRLPFGTRVKVTNLENNREIVVTINDRGPHKRGRIIDLSWMAARQLKMLKKGVAKVRIEVFK
ncbi:MAG: septal ring lytic transglycosylase RlpA family protein [Candidatus Omnitrophota bacterium]|nr:MAG: septal ring lytic transglycosylase RlpA family protein [Candidatus Omnitrophota bacterium]